MKKSELRKIIKEELDNITNDTEERGERGSYDVTSKYIDLPSGIVKGSKQYMFQPKTGDAVTFKIDDVKDTEGTIKGFSNDGTIMYIRTHSEHYIKIQLATEGHLIEKITLDNNAVILPTGTIV